MSKASIKRLYLIIANIYDPLMILWINAVARQSERELSSFLKANLGQTSTILELGCGTGRNLETIIMQELKLKKYLGLDFSPQMLAKARSKFAGKQAIEFAEQDITALDNITERFDIILSTWVLSHLPSPSAFVNGAQALLKPGGKFFLTFYTRPKWYINFWISPLSTYLLSSRPVAEKEVRAIRNIRVRHSYAANIITCLEVYK